MSASTALLISDDDSLIRSVEGVIDSISELRLEVKARVQDAFPLLKDGAFPLVVVHSVHQEDDEDVVRLLQLLSSMVHPTAAVVLAEEHRPEEALRVLRQGAADYLSRPLDLI